MNETITTSDLPAKTTRKNSKMSATSRKAISDAAKARWAKRKATAPNKGYTSPVPAQAFAAPTPLPPSPSVLALQDQVVQRVSQRDEVRQRLTEAHTAYLLAQSRFQAAEAELKGIEQEVNYRISLIAQLENRVPTLSIGGTPMPQMPQMPQNLGQMITSEPAQQMQQTRQTQEQFAVGLADDIRRDIRGNMGMM